VPQTLINAIRSNEKIQDLTVVSNNAGNSGNGGLCESPPFVCGVLPWFGVCHHWHGR
jgi:hypothetical protein